MRIDLDPSSRDLKKAQVLVPIATRGPLRVIFDQVQRGLPNRPLPLSPESGHSARFMSTRPNEIELTDRR